MGVVNMAKDNIQTCGFPKNAIPKVMSKLEQKKINFIIVDTRNNYEVDEENDNKNLSSTKKCYFFHVLHNLEIYMCTKPFDQVFKFLQKYCNISLKNI